MIDVTLSQPWLDVHLPVPHRMLSWSINRPGYTTGRHIVWREVRNADLPEDLDVHAWFEAELAESDRSDALGLITSRAVSAFVRSEAVADGVRATAVATVGLSNAERIGTRMDRNGQSWGTINVAAIVDSPMSDTGLLEALSIATEARTTAVIEAGHDLPTGIATGTGTDCLVVAAPSGPNGYAGLHTPVGEALGRAVLTAVAEGTRHWLADVAGS